MNRERNNNNIKKPDRGDISSTSPTFCAHMLLGPRRAQVGSFLLTSVGLTAFGKTMNSSSYEVSVHTDVDTSLGCDWKDRKCLRKILHIESTSTIYVEECLYSGTHMGPTHDYSKRRVLSLTKTL